MTLWIVLAAMTGVAALVVIYPLAKAGRARVSSAAHEESVYRDQLQEIERDVANGVLTERDAEAARTEIARRVIKAARAAEAEATGPTRSVGRLVAIGAIVLVPAIGLGTYLLLGNPHLPDQPLAARLSVPGEGQPLEVLIARVERHLGANPNDGEGWNVVAPVYQRIGRLQEAATAYRNANRLLGASAEREARLGEVIAGMNGGVVVAEARAAFERAVALDRSMVLPHMYLALALSQEGKFAQSASAWRALIARGSGTEAWMTEAQSQLKIVEARIAGAAQPAPSTPGATAPNAGGQAATAPGPSADDMAAAANMSEEDRQKMIETMVASLADRLQAKGGTPDEWIRLMRSYRMLGKADEARQAAEAARAAHLADPTALQAIEAAIKSLGITL